MANVLVQESSLSDIADSIRAKNGTQNTYKPGQMAAAIDAIPSGGISPTGTLEITENGTYDVTNYAEAEVDVPTGSTPVINPLSVTENGTYTAPSGVDGYSPVTVNVPSSTPTGTKQISITANGTTTEDVSAYASVEITVNVSGGGSGSESDLAKLCNATLTRLDDDGITNINSQLLRGLSKNLTVVFLRNLATITTSYALACSSLLTAVFPSIQKTSSAGFFFSGATQLTTVDMGSSFSTESVGLRGNTFNGASAMNKLILRKNSVVPLAGINAFTNTPFANGKAGGTLYVPSALISSYQSATNWSTILGYSTNSIQSIEGSIYENAYADGTLIG